MHSRTTAASLTESRIRKILDLHDHLRQKTRKDAQKFLQIPRLPDLGQGETLEEVVAPQMARTLPVRTRTPCREIPRLQKRCCDRPRDMPRSKSDNWKRSAMQRSVPSVTACRKSRAGYWVG